MSEDLPPQAPVAVNVADHNIKGDWVLFHPVYTHDELRSVEVCICRSLMLSIPFSYATVGTAQAGQDVLG